MPQSILTLRLFGALEASLDGAPMPGLHLREGERLLAYLTLRHGVAISYRQLAQLFWPSEARLNDDFDGGNYPSTRQAIYSLRRALGEHAWRLASPNKGVVCLDLTGADVDLLTFDRLVQQDDIDAWQQAIALYRGPLLEGWSEGWAQTVRTRCQRSFDRLTAALAQQSVQRPPTNVNGRIGVESEVEECVRLETVGGAVPLDSRFYVERGTDAEFQEAITRRDSIVLVKGARQMGKTSLLARGLQRARQSGSRVLLTDFQSLSEDPLASAHTLYRTLAQDMADQLDLETSPEEVWNERRSANRNLERFLCDVALGPDDASLVWGLDEVDRLFSYPFGSEVFGLFRSWHNRRALDPTGPWSRLTLVIAYASEAHLFISDTNQSPFNVGTRLTLADFTLEQVAELNRRHGQPLQNAEQLQEFHQLVGGHPYLVRRGLAEMVARRLDLPALRAQADQEDGLFGDHLRRIRTTLLQDADLREEMRKVVRREPCTTLDNFYRLRSIGLIAGSGVADAHPRCNLYANYLALHLP